MGPRQNSHTPLAPVSGEPVEVALRSESIDIPAPLAGNVFSVLVAVGDHVVEGDTILVLEAMKMETEIRSSATGIVAEILVKDGDAVKVGDVLLMLN